MHLFILFTLNAPMANAQATCPDVFKARCEQRKNAAESFQPNVTAGDGLKDVSNAQAAAFTSMAQAWESARDFCSDQRKSCEKSCAGAADQCDSKLKPLIWDANTKMAGYKGQASESTGVAAYGDDQESDFKRQLASEGARVEQARTNLDAIREMSGQGGCSQSGAGNMTQCIDSDGMMHDVPSGPGTAYSPYGGQSLGPVKVSRPAYNEIRF